MYKRGTERTIKYFLFFASALSMFLISAAFYVIPPAECSAFSASVLNGRPSAFKKSKKKKYYTEGKMYIMLKISKNLKAYINKKNQKVYPSDVYTSLTSQFNINILFFIYFIYFYYIHY